MNRAEKRRQQKLAKKSRRFASASGQPTGISSHTQQALHLAEKHRAAGRFPEAESICQQILQPDPNQPDALHLLGVIAYQVGRHDTAVELITKALDIKPNFAAAHSNLGNALKGLSRLDDAVDSYTKAILLNPDLAVAHNNLGNTLQELGQLDKAVASYQKALHIDPGYAEAHSNLGDTFRDLGRLDDAITSCEKSIAIRPDFAEAHGNLGAILYELNRLDEAIASYRKALSINPDLAKLWSDFAESIRFFSFTSADDNLRKDLLHLLDRPIISPFKVVRPVISALRHQPDFSQILELITSAKPEIKIYWGDVAERLSAIPLFLRLIEQSPIYDLEIEGVLTFLRRAMIKEAAAGKTDVKGLAFSTALALQCFINEYVYPETGEEKAAVENLCQRIAGLVESELDVPPSFIATLGAYRPLYIFPWARELSEREWVGCIRRVIEQQISEPLEERSLRPRIPHFTPIEDVISQSVREQYEENPYPRWIKTYIMEKGGTMGSVFQRPRFNLNLGDYVSPKSPEILIAGCGTGRHALETTSLFLGARTLAVDLSLSSLSYAWRKTKELGLSNIEYVQADIMELGSLERRFHLIESVGVLHHLGDPLAGWQLLADLLHSDGLMKIGLYSKKARRNIFAGHSLIAEEGYTSSPEDIRRCRQDIITRAGNGDQEMVGICNITDFFSLSNCRDLLFHVQEHCFTLPEVEAALQSLNLEFLGFEIQSHIVLKKFKKAHPQKSALTSLSLWHSFELENPDTFRGMYQFWCKKI